MCGASPKTICRSTSLAAKADNPHLPPTARFVYEVPWWEGFWRVGVLKAKGLNKKRGCKVLGFFFKCKINKLPVSFPLILHFKKPSLDFWNLSLFINSSHSLLMLRCMRIARLFRWFHRPVLKVSLFHPQMHHMALLYSLEDNRLIHMQGLLRRLQSNWIKLINLMFLC